MHLCSALFHLFFAIHRMIKDSNTNLNKGIAFCEYLSPDVASRAITELRGQELHGRTLRFDNADGKRLNVFIDSLMIYCLSGFGQ